MRVTLADSPVVAVKSLRIAVGVEPRGGVVLVSECDQPEGRNRMSEPKSQVKSHDIPKRMVWGAWLKVKENGGAAGADGVSGRRSFAPFAVRDHDRSGSSATVSRPSR